MASRGETRHHLLRAAAQQIHRQGFCATGVAAILDAAGTGASSFYHFFDSKEELLMEVLDSYETHFLENIAGAASRSWEDPVDRAFGILDYYRDFLLETECALGCPIGNLAGELSDSHPQLRERLEHFFMLWRQAVAGCFAEIASQLPLGVDPGALGIVFLSAMEGSVMQARVSRTLDPFETTYWYLRDHVNRLLGRVEPVL